MVNRPNQVLVVLCFGCVCLCVCMFVVGCFLHFVCVFAVWYGCVQKAADPFSCSLSRAAERLLHAPRTVLMKNCIKVYLRVAKATQQSLELSRAWQLIVHGRRLSQSGTTNNNMFVAVCVCVCLWLVCLCLCVYVRGWYVCVGVFVCVCVYVAWLQLHFPLVTIERFMIAWLRDPRSLCSVNNAVLWPCFLW